MSIHAPAPVRTLAASSLPPRVRAILERLLVVVDDGVGSMVDRLLMDFELELQRQAASAVPALQGRYEGLVRTVQRGGIVLRPRVHAQVEDAFARLREPPVREAPAAPAIPDFSSLQLMHEQEVDERPRLQHHEQPPARRVRTADHHRVARGRAPAEVGASAATGQPEPAVDRGGGTAGRA